MGKLVLFLTFISLFILIAGSLLMPNDPTMWMAGTSTGFIVLRVIVCIALIALLITNPPRNPLLRYVIGLFAAGLIVGSAVLTYDNQMKFLDSLSLMAAGTSMSIVVLEINYESETQKQRAFAGHGRQSSRLNLKHIPAH